MKRLQKLIRSLSLPSAVNLTLLSVWLTVVLLTSGCDQLSSVAHDLGVTQVEARTGEGDIASFQSYQEALLGKSPDEVITVFGKPSGVFEKQNGKVWMYSRWCVEFDNNEQVVRLERDIASNGSRDSSPSSSQKLTARPAVVNSTASGSADVQRISNGGQTVDLGALTRSGKITIVDFYADWCGPCRKISPHLEKLAADHSDVVLVKVDIVKWGTPVTKQYAINSVPNVRVFDASGNQIGQPTHSLSEVQANLTKARK